MRLTERVSKLEAGMGGPASPAPYGGIAYAGVRDPVTIMRALGLDGIAAASFNVLPVGAEPNDPPRLVGELTSGGRGGMGDELQAFSQEAYRHVGTGTAWSFYWRRGGKGFVLDQTGAPDAWFRDYDCIGVGL